MLHNVQTATVEPALPPVSSKTYYVDVREQVYSDLVIFHEVLIVQRRLIPDPPASARPTERVAVVISRYQSCLEAKRLQYLLHNEWLTVLRFHQALESEQLVAAARDLANATLLAMAYHIAIANGELQFGDLLFADLDPAFDVRHSDRNYLDIVRKCRFQWPDSIQPRVVAR